MINRFLLFIIKLCASHDLGVDYAIKVTLLTEYRLSFIKAKFILIAQALISHIDFFIKHEHFHLWTFVIWRFIQWRHTVFIFARTYSNSLDTFTMQHAEKYMMWFTENMLWSWFWWHLQKFEICFLPTGCRLVWHVACSIVNTCETQCTAFAARQIHTWILDVCFVSTAFLV